MILGIDEVGRGPWAGPLVVGAVVLGGADIRGLTDSKKLTKKRREELDQEIRKKAKAWALGWVSAHELDEIGMSAALKLATRRAVEQIRAPYHEIVIDGRVNFLADTKKGQYVTTLPKADLLVPCVSAASIIAKVARDNYMTQQAEEYPEYGFQRNAGYGVKIHREALDRFGPTPLHRMSFAPIARLQEAQSLPAVQNTTTNNPVDETIGRRAEAAAADYLARAGHRIIERNWKTKWCEIDIVSVRDATIYFTEVKYRSNPSTGTGVEAITKHKLRQLKFAAELYLAHHPDKNGQLICIAAAGEDPEVTEYLEVI